MDDGPGRDPSPPGPLTAIALDRLTSNQYDPGRGTAPSFIGAFIASSPLGNVSSFEFSA